MDRQSTIGFLNSDTIALGPLRSDLVTTYQRWSNTLQVLRTVALACRPVTEDVQRDWLDNMLVSNTNAMFTMYERTSVRPIGMVGLHNIDHMNGTADFGIVIGEPDAWGKGFGTEATRLTLAYGFDVLGLHNVLLEVYTHNPAGLKAYERAGFKRVGVRRGAFAVGRERHDVVYMDATAGDFETTPLHRLMQRGVPAESDPC